MNRPRMPRRRALTRAVFALLPALLISSGVAYADHQPNHDPKITICHATGSDTNPFVEITISVNGLNGHLNSNHQGLEDIVPAPVGGCPGPVTPPPPTDVCPNIDGNQATVPAGLVLVNGQCVTPPTTPDAPTPDGPTVTPDTPTTPGDTPATPDAPDAPEADTPTATDTAGTPDEAAQAGATTAPADDPTPAAAGAALPFTGAPTWLVAVIGFGLVLAGSLLHVAPRRKVARAAH